MVGPIYAQVEDFSRSVVDLIAEIRPEWLPLCQVVDGLDGQVVELTWRNGRDTGPVIFSTVAGEITVFIGEYHQHFGYREQGDRNIFLEAMSFVDDFFLERRATVLIKRQGKPRLGGTIRVDAISKILALPSGDHEVVIRSWSGLFDSQRSIDWQSYLDHVFNQNGEAKR